MIKFTDIQLNRLNSIEHEETRKKAMCVYAYLLRYSNENILTESINRLFKIYEKHHKEVKYSRFKQLVHVLKDIGLVDIEKKGRGCIYTMLNPGYLPEKEYVNNFQLSNELSNGLSNKKEVQPTDTTSVEGDKSLRKYIIYNKAYTYTLNTDPCLSNVVAPIELVFKATEMLKDLNIKSKIVKDNVIEKLRKCSMVNRNGMISYIATVIAEKKNQNEIKRDNYMQNRKYNQASNLNFNNFSGRDRSEGNEYGYITEKDIENHFQDGLNNNRLQMAQ